MKWHIRTRVTLLSLLHIGNTNAAINNDLEVDLIFPRANTSYNAPRAGIPITIALQNSAAAFQYGWNMNFDFYKNPRNDAAFGEQSVSFSNAINSPTPSNATDPYFLTMTSGFLQPGEYTLAWTLNIASYCEFESSPSSNSSTYYGNKLINRGTLNLTIVDDTNSTADAPPNLLSNDNGKACPQNLGVIGYASTSQWTHPALTVGSFDTSKGSYVYPSTAEACVVTKTPTGSPDPCHVTANKAVQSNIYELMSWSLNAMSTSAPTTGTAGQNGPAKTSQGTGAAGSLRMEASQNVAFVWGLSAMFLLGMLLV